MWRLDHGARPLLVVVALLAWLVGSGASRASDTALHFDQWPFTAIGKLNVVTGPGSRHHCTATLVGPRLILTAAHCLYDRARGRWVEPAALHFLAGYQLGSHTAHARGVAVRQAGDLAIERVTSAAHLSQDWALVELERDVPIGPVPVRPIGELDEDRLGGLPIVRAGYRAGAHQVLTPQVACVASMVPNAALLLDTCDAVPGESGSALFSFSEGAPSIVGILVAHSDGTSIAVSSEAFAAALTRLGADRTPIRAHAASLQDTAEVERRILSRIIGTDRRAQRFEPLMSAQGITHFRDWTR